VAAERSDRRSAFDSADRVRYAFIGDPLRSSMISAHLPQERDSSDGIGTRSGDSTTGGVAIGVVCRVLMVDTLA